MEATFPANDRAAPASRADVQPPYLGDMVTVARRFNSLEAELLRGRLVADGIPATLGDAHTVQTDTLLTAALGGVRIRVPASFEEQARRTISDIEAGAFMLDEGEDVSGAAGGSGAQDALGARVAAEFSASRREDLSRPAFATVVGLVFLGVLAAFAS
jgi:hypothetical protein